jgi:hypothetical protein
MTVVIPASSAVAAQARATTLVARKLIHSTNPVIADPACARITCGSAAVPLRRLRQMIVYASHVSWPFRAVLWSWLRQPRPGTHSQGFGACEEDGGDQ